MRHFNFIFCLRNYYNLLSVLYSHKEERLDWPCSEGQPAVQVILQKHASNSEKQAQNKQFNQKASLKMSFIGKLHKTKNKQIILKEAGKSEHTIRK